MWDELVAYKVGFEKTSRLYYSWIGGVIPKYRRRGIAEKLMKQQHELALKLNYKFVQTHTKNKFRPMLLLNIKNGFNIVGVYTSTHNNDQKIILEKTL